MMGTEVSKEHLQDLGKQAASIHAKSGRPMTDAVVSVLHKEAGLGAEHVKRVVEFANNEAYLDQFNAMDGEHRVVNIENGPASPGQVLRELEMSDSAPALVKSASRADALRAFIPGEDEFGSAFDKVKTAGVNLPDSRPNTQLIHLREKLAAAKSYFVSQLSSAELGYDSAASNMYDMVKQAVLGGTSPAEISVLYQRVSPSPVLTKLALRTIAERMEPECIPAVTTTKEKIKEASERAINPSHPLVRSFLEFAKVAEERIVTLSRVEEVNTELKRVNQALHGAML